MTIQASTPMKLESPTQTEYMSDLDEELECASLVAESESNNAPNQAVPKSEELSSNYRTLRMTLAGTQN